MAVAVPALPLAPAPGRMYVDFEERLDFGRLRQYRLDRAKAAMENAGLGALLVFDNNNIRYLTGVAIGEWTRDKLCRYALYTRTGELVLWDFGSAAVHHRMYCPWLKPENCIASYTTMRGAAPPGSGLTHKQVAEIKDRLQQRRHHKRAHRRRLGRGPHLLRAATTRPANQGRPAGHAGRPGDQVPGRDHPAVHRRRPGRRHLPGHRRRAQARRAGERDRRPGQQAAVRDGLRRRGERSTRCPASGATRTRTTSPTA